MLLNVGPKVDLKAVGNFVICLNLFLKVSKTPVRKRFRINKLAKLADTFDKISE